MKGSPSTSSRAAFAALSALAAGALACFKFYSMDGWLHLAAGRWIVDNLAVPSVDPFTIAQPAWRYHEWLPGLLSYLVHSVGGFPLLTVAKVGFVAALGLVLHAIARGRGASPALASVAVAVGMWGAHFRLNLRPHLAFFMAIALTVLAIDKARAGRRHWLWVLPGIAALWANSHGSFLVGPALVASALIARLLEAPLAARGLPIGPQRDPTPPMRWAAVALAMCGALVLNPYGLDLLGFAFHVEGMDAAKRLIGEWRTPVAADWLSVTGGVSAAALVGLVAAARARRVQLFDLAVIVLVTALSVRAIRFHAVFCLLAAPIAAGWWGRALGDRAATWRSGRAQVAAGLAIAGLVVFAIRSRAVFTPGIGLDDRLYPLAAGDFTRGLHTPGHVAAPYLWGATFIWQVGPGSGWTDRRVLVDGRAEIQDPTAMAGWLSGDRAAWQAQLDNPDLTVLVTLRPPGAPGQAALRLAPWTLVFWDDLSAVYVRTDRADPRDLALAVPDPGLLAARGTGVLTDCGALTQLVSASTQHHESAYWLAHCRFQGGDRAGAEAAMAQALDVRVEAGAYNDLALMRSQWRDLAGAEAAFRDALAAQPVYPEAAFNLAGLLWDGGRRPEAKALYQRFLDQSGPELAAARRMAQERVAQP